MTARRHEIPLHRMRVASLLTENRTALNYSDDPKLDRVMVIVLAALLSALLFVLGVNSVVRCALRSHRWFSPEEEAAAAALPPPTGLKEDVLKQIPVVVYKAGMDVLGTECPICLGEFNDGQRLRLLPKCNHGFHLKCIDLWLLSHSSCPTCRQLLLGHSS